MEATAIINAKLEILDIKTAMPDPTMMMAQKILIKTNIGDYVVSLKTNDLYELFMSDDDGLTKQQAFNKILARKLKEAIEASQAILRIQGKSTDS
jgi:hypothetical protein